MYACHPTSPCYPPTPESHVSPIPKSPVSHPTQSSISPHPRVQLQSPCLSPPQTPWFSSYLVVPCLQPTPGPPVSLPLPLSYSTPEPLVSPNPEPLVFLHLRAPCLLPPKSPLSSLPQSPLYNSTPEPPISPYLSSEPLSPPTLKPLVSLHPRTLCFPHHRAPISSNPRATCLPPPHLVAMHLDVTTY